MSKTSIILGAVSVVSVAVAGCLGGLCLLGYISDEIWRKQKMEHDIELATIRKLFHENLLQEKNKI